MRGTGRSGIHPVDKHVGARLKDLRAMKAFSQGDIACALGLTFQQIQQYESGANRMSASKLWEAAGFLGVDVEDFYLGLGAPGRIRDLSDPSQCPSSDEILRLVSRLSPSRRKLAMTLMKAMAADL